MQVEERFDYAGVELSSAALPDLAECVFDRAGGPIRPVVSHGVEAVDDSDDTSSDWDCLPREAGRIPVAVPALVVREGNLLP